MYYYSTIRLTLIYRPSEGGRLSLPRHCSQCAARAQSCVSQWFSWKRKLLSAVWFEPGPSRAAGKRAITRPLWPQETQEINKSDWNVKTSWWMASKSDCPIAGSITIRWTFSITFFNAEISLGCTSPTMYLFVFASSSRFWIRPSTTLS